MLTRPSRLLNGVASQSNPNKGGPHRTRCGFISKRLPSRKKEEVRDSFCH